MKHRTAGTSENVYTPEQDITFFFALSTGWTDHQFATNVRVTAPRADKFVHISLAVNEAHQGIHNAMSRARRINSRLTARDTIEHMKHALMDHPSLPENVHSAVIGNMGSLALAHGMRFVNLGHPDLIGTLLKVAQEYDALTVQQYESLHDQIMLQAGLNNQAAS